MKEVIKDYCKQLRWGNSIVRNYGNIDAETHEEFLAKLLEMEVKKVCEGSNPNGSYKMVLLSTWVAIVAKCSYKPLSLISGSFRAIVLAISFSSAESHP